MAVIKDRLLPVGSPIKRNQLPNGQSYFESPKPQQRNTTNYTNKSVHSSLLKRHHHLLLPSIILCIYFNFGLLFSRHFDIYEKLKNTIEISEFAMIPTSLFSFNLLCRFGHRFFQRMCDTTKVSSSLVLLSITMAILQLTTSNLFFNVIDYPNIFIGLCLLAYILGGCAVGTAEPNVVALSTYFLNTRECICSIPAGVAIALIFGYTLKWLQVDVSHIFLLTFISNICISFLWIKYVRVNHFYLKYRNIHSCDLNTGHFISNDSKPFLYSKSSNQIYSNIYNKSSYSINFFWKSEIPIFVKSLVFIFGLLYGWSIFCVSSLIPGALPYVLNRHSSSSLNIPIFLLFYCLFGSVGDCLCRHLVKRENIYLFILGPLSSIGFATSIIYLISRNNINILLLLISACGLQSANGIIYANCICYLSTICSKEKFNGDNVIYIDLNLLLSVFLFIGDFGGILGNYCLPYWIRLME